MIFFLPALIRGCGYSLHFIELGVQNSNKWQRLQNGTYFVFLQLEGTPKRTGKNTGGGEAKAIYLLKTDL